MALQPKNEPTYAEGFKEDEHPRGGKGTKEGGKFVPKGASGTATKDTEKKSGKEDWQKTRREYLEPFYDDAVKKGLVSAEEAAKDLKEALSSPVPFGESAHKQKVEQALKEGKPVPTEVLKDYPDLQKEAEEKGLVSRKSEGEQPEGKEGDEEPKSQKKEPLTGEKWVSALSDKEKDNGDKKEPESKPEDSPFKEHKPERPKLREGLSYGDDITIDQLQIGDTIQASGDKSISSISGKITKVNPKTIVLVTKYFDNDMTLTVKKSDLRGMVVVGRGDKVHVVNKDEEA
jgi:hypothetical protein